MTALRTNLSPSDETDEHSVPEQLNQINTYQIAQLNGSRPVLVTSPNGSVWQIAVSNAGVVSATASAAIPNV